jgi:hypothetical protein
VGRDIPFAVQAGPEAYRDACTVGYRIFPLVKWPESDDDQQPLSSVGLRIFRNYTTTLPRSVPRHITGELRLFTFKINKRLFVYFWHDNSQ